MKHPTGHSYSGAFYLSTLLLFSTALASAQPVCKTEKDHLDEFTDKHVIQITASEHFEGPRFDWLSVNEQLCLRIHWATDDARPAVIFEGDTLLLKLENDTVLTLISMETIVGKQVTGENGERFTKATYSYWIDHDQFALINHFWVQKLRIYFREGHHDFEAVKDPGWQMGFWRSSNCMRMALALPAFPVPSSGFGHHREHRED